VLHEHSLVSSTGGLLYLTSMVVVLDEGFLPFPRTEALSLAFRLIEEWKNKVSQFLRSTRGVDGVISARCLNSNSSHKLN
jgi:hypothetical protein